MAFTWRNMADDEDAIVVSFNDSLLRKSDVDLLDGPKWLNDRLIGFCFEYFEKEQFSHSADRVSFISPEVTQFIKLAAATELGAFLEPLNLPTKQFVFLAVNNNQSTNQAGGTHWSLLLYNRPRQEFQHYDSNTGANKLIASELARKLQPFVRAPAGRLKFIEKDSPQQSNGHDCGVYVVAVAEYMSKELVEGLCIPLSDTVTSKVIEDKRLHIKEIIEEIAALPEHSASAGS